MTVLALVNAASSGGVSTARNKLTLIAPAAPGGGWEIDIDFVVHTDPATGAVCGVARRAAATPCGGSSP